MAQVDIPPFNLEDFEKAYNEYMCYSDPEEELDVTHKESFQENVPSQEENGLTRIIMVKRGEDKDEDDNCEEVASEEVAVDDRENKRGTTEDKEIGTELERSSENNLTLEEKPQLLSYQSVVREFRNIKEGNDFYNTSTKVGINGELPFLESPMYKYLMRFVEVPKFHVTEEQKQKVEKDFFRNLFQMLVFDETTSWRLERNGDEFELIVTSEDMGGFFETKVSEMTIEDLKDLMTFVIVESWPEYNFTLSRLFPEDKQVDADLYIESWSINKCKYELIMYY